MQVKRKTVKSLGHFGVFLFGWNAIFVSYHSQPSLDWIQTGIVTTSVIDEVLEAQPRCFMGECFEGGFMPNDKIKKEEAKLAKRQQQLKRARDAERIQKRKLTNLKRNERTHRLCVRGGMLESLLKRPGCIDPAEIEDEQLRAFLASLLSLPGVESKLTELLPPDTSGDNLEPDGGDNLTS